MNCLFIHDIVIVETSDCDYGIYMVKNIDNNTYAIDAKNDPL